MQVTCGEPVVSTLAIGIYDSNVRAVTPEHLCLSFEEKMKFDDVNLVSHKDTEVVPKKEVALTQVESEVPLEVLDKNLKCVRTSCARGQESHAQ